MKNVTLLIAIVSLTILASSCASKKTLNVVRFELQSKNQQLKEVRTDLADCNTVIRSKDQNIALLVNEKENLSTQLNNKDGQINDLKEQITDLKSQRDKQLTQVGDLTVLSKTANENIGQTIKQLEQKDKYIQLLNAAKTKADSINLALAINLKSVLRRGIDDEDIEVKVDKTVVYVNLSDNMLFQSGSSQLTPRANEVLGKIAQIIASRPDLDLMVEGYTDNVPIKNACISDNWDLSVIRATAVVRVLQQNFGIDPNKLIAAGRGEYNVLADNNSSEGRSMNRRTRIILLPKLNQFYDLLNPNKLTQGK
jgi:chemotaxis protein MotB